MDEFKETFDALDKINERRQFESRGLDRKTGDEKWTDDELSLYTKVVGHPPSEVVHPLEDRGKEPNVPDDTTGATTGGGGGQPPPDYGGVTIGQFEDYKAMVEQAMNQLGFYDLAQDYKTMNPLTDIDKVNEIVGYAKAKFDVEGVMNALRQRPDLIAINPGLPYGMSREDYYNARAGDETAFGDKFGDPADLAAVKDKQKNPTPGGTPAEPDWLKQVFHEKLNPQQSAAMFSDYFKRTGRPPTSAEIGQYKSRAQQQYGSGSIEPAFQQSSAGARSPGLGGPARNVGSG